MIELTPLTPHVGARVRGVDLGQPLDAAAFEVLHEGFLRHHVLIFPDQDLEPAQQIAFASRWGEIEPHPYVPPIPGFREVMEVYDPHPITLTWHQDFTHSKTPPRLTCLVAKRVPAVGGDTMFANQHVAFERLSPAFRGLIEPLRAVHRGTVSAAREAGLAASEVEAVHPVVCRHPETGRPGLYVNATYVKHLEGMTEAESRPLLEFLYAQAAQPEYSFRHHWTVGDLVMWDNFSVQHRAIADVAKGERSLYRVTVQGTEPAGV